MEKIGIIAEYNPFHNGHLYHLNKAKELFPNGTFILVLVGNFTQRGDVSIINKWDKAKLALNNGFDLVVELPYIFATSSADVYATGAIETLNNLKCNYLVFGSETNDINLFEFLAKESVNNTEYDLLLKSSLAKGLNFPSACSSALKSVTNTEINKPNDILALEYVKAIKKTNSNIKPVSIKRINNYHSKKISNNITSATSIRNNINNINLIKNALPNDSLDLIQRISLDDYFKYLKYQILTNDNLKDILGVDEGLENKLKKEINNVYSLDGLILKLKSKRYSYNRLKRMMLHIICNVNKSDNDLKIKYVRVLAFNKLGQKVLNEVKKETNVPIITKFKKEYNDLLKLDIKATNVYSLIGKTENDFISSKKSN